MVTCHTIWYQFLSFNRSYLTLYQLVQPLSSADLTFENSLDPDQALQIVGPVMVPNCLAPSKYFSTVSLKDIVETPTADDKNLPISSLLRVKLILTLNAPIATKVVCFSRLLKCLRSLYGKQCGPSLDCSYSGSRCLLLYLIRQQC